MTDPPDAFSPETLEDFLHGLAEHVPVPMAVHDLEQNLVWGNAAYRDATGLAPSELRGEKCFVCWGLSGPCLRCPVTEVLETGESTESELTPENQPHWPDSQGSWLSRAVPLRSESGEVLGVLEVALEITDRKAAEARDHHLTAVLYAVQGVGKVLTRSAEEGSLIEDVCGALVGTRGFGGSMILLNPGPAGDVLFAQKGFSPDGFRELVSEMEEGRLPACFETARQAGEVTRITKPEPLCAGCPLAEDHPDLAALSVPLRHEDREFGFLGVTVDRAYAEEPDLWELLQGVARDLAFTLQDLEYRRQRQESDLFQRALLDGIPSPVFYKDVQGVYLGCNKAFEEYFGRPEEKMVGKTVFDLNPPKLAALYDAKDRELFQDGGRQRYEGPVENAQGEVRDVVFHKAPFHDASGRIAGLIGVVHDITELKRAQDEIEAANLELESSNERLEMRNRQLRATERELAEAYALLQAALDNSPAGIAIAEAPDGRLRYVNQAGLLIRGRSAEDVVEGISAEDYVASWRILDLDGTPLETDEVPLARAVLYGETNSREFIVRRDNEEDRIVWATAAPIRNDEGEVFSAMVVFLDVTERIMAERSLAEKTELLQESEEALRALTHRLQAIREQEREALSQDLHDQLGGVLTGLRMDIDQLRAEAQGEGSRYAQALSNLLELADEAVQFARDYSADLRSPVLDLLGLGPAVRAHVERLEGRFPATFTMDIDETELDCGPEVEINVFRIAQEALTNVLRHSQADEVHVAFGNRNGQIVLEVKDNGCGIPETVLRDGSSLGLLGLRERAMALEGELTIESFPDRGTKVRLQVPLRA